MITYTIAQVEALTGIKSHTLRIWESRYNFLKPGRTDTNIRYYTDELVRLLINVATLNRNGIKISKIQQLSSGEINEKVLALYDHVEVNIRSEFDRLTHCMLDMDEMRFEQIIEEQFQEHGVYKTIINVVYPFLNHVGILWATEKVMPAQEHFISNILRSKIIVAIDDLPQPPENEPSIMLFLTEEEEHEIGLLLASYIAKVHGWRVIYLGQRVPAQNALEVEKLKSPDLAFTILISPFTKKYERQINAAIAKLKTPLLVAGTPESYDKFSKALRKVTYISSPNAFVDYLINYTRKQV